MKPRTVLHLTRQGLGNLWRHRFVGLAAFTITTFIMVVMGIFLAFIANVTNFSRAMEDRVQLKAILVDGLNAVQRDEIGTSIREIPGVRRVQFVTKDEALAEVKKQMGGREELFAIDTENPMPDSYKISVNRGTNWEQLSQKIGQVPGVEEVSYGKEIVQNFLSFTRMLSVATLAFTILLAVATVLIVMNTIRLTVYARRREIEIMRLVGATDSYIRFPFVIEGMSLGLLSALVAEMLVDRAYLWMGTRLIHSFPFIPWIGRDLLWLQIVGTLLLLGVFIGGMGSYLSVKRYLRV